MKLPLKVKSGKKTLLDFDRGMIFSQTVCLLVVEIFIYLYHI